MRTVLWVHFSSVFVFPPPFAFRNEPMSNGNLQDPDYGLAILKKVAHVHLPLTSYQRQNQFGIALNGWKRNFSADQKPLKRNIWRQFGWVGVFFLPISFWFHLWAPFIIVCMFRMAKFTGWLNSMRQSWS